MAMCTSCRKVQDMSDGLYALECDQEANVHKGKTKTEKKGNH